MTSRHKAILTGGLPALLAGLLIGQNPAQAAAKYKMLYAFQSGADGAYPVGRLAQLGTDLFGVTLSGGSVSNNGTVFRVTASGAEQVIHAFAGAPTDGANPGGGLAVLGTTLFGTTAGGGPGNCVDGNKCGTVFRITPGGTEKIIHFQPSAVFSPTSDLLSVDHAVWGASALNGGVFKTDLSGRTSNYTVGADPMSGLVRVYGAFFGTTFSGGIQCDFELWCGTVYKMTPTGQVSTVYEFQGGTDGSGPAGNLVFSHGFLYGITTAQTTASVTAIGTVFRLTRSGQKKVLYSFSGGTDGQGPVAGLAELNGTFFGSTEAGGGTGCGGQGCGTIFSIRPDGTYKQLYRFQGGADGQSPMSQLVAWNGVLYGTTYFGGGGPCTDNPFGTGCGTIFRLTP